MPKREGIPLSQLMGTKPEKKKAPRRLACGYAEAREQSGLKDKR